jgi:uncharacterized lipoprotein
VNEEQAMKKNKALVLTAIAAALLAGCGKQEPDCSKPKNQQERDQCAAHKTSTEPRGPDTLPANPKKW